MEIQTLSLKKRRRHLMIGKYLSPIVTAGLTATMLSFAAPVLAETESVSMTHTVRYSDIDLSTANGRQTLDHRVEVAINSMCAEPVLGNQQEMQAFQDCRADARVQAATKVNALLAVVGKKYASAR
ncbi:MAG: UrcA family protein [Sandarakinorhabdus sp.]|nr:UrcA family protein [Sandarakinorhabdus sp.]